MKKYASYIARDLKLSAKYLELVLSGKKTSTIRRKFVLFSEVVIPIISAGKQILVKIEKLDYSKTFADLTDEDARSDGFDSIEILRSELKNFYTDITDDYPMTIIHFKLED